VELRRALLLFAVVLGLAAVASSLNRPAEEEGNGDAGQAERATERPAAREDPETGSPRPGGGGREPATGGPAEVRFEAGGRPEVRRIEGGAATTVMVEVNEPGEVSIDGLGLTQPAEPLTPARFEVLLEQPGSSEVVVDPASGASREVIGTLVVKGGR
jgi:hypothetical protein